MSTTDESTRTEPQQRPLRAGLNLAPAFGIGVVLLAALITTPGFYSGTTLALVLFQVGFIGIAAIGQTLVLISGGIDLSVGAVIGLTSVIVATQTEGANDRLPWALLLALLAGVAVGAANGALVLVRRVPPFVATFATFVLVQGVIMWWTGGAPSGSIPGALGPLGTGRLLGLPVPVWLFAVLVVAGAIVLARTTFGRRLYASGANPRATAMSGVRTGLVVGSAYVACAVLAVVAGLVYAGYIGYVDAELARTLNLDSIAAAVVGGVALTGGRGHMGQTLAGVVLLSLLVVWMVQLGTGPGGRFAVVGAAILLAALAQQHTFSLRSLSGKGGRTR